MLSGSAQGCATKCNLLYESLSVHTGYVLAEFVIVLALQSTISFSEDVLRGLEINIRIRQAVSTDVIGAFVGAIHCF